MSQRKSLSVPKGSRLRILRALAEQPGSNPATLRKYITPHLPRGTMYTTLKRLEAEGFVRSRTKKGEQSPGPSRRYFFLTTQGTNALHVAAITERLL